jgi:hypothetical protein
LQFSGKSLNKKLKQKKSVTEMEITMEHGIMHPSNSPLTTKIIYDRDGIKESK